MSSGAAFKANERPNPTGGGGGELMSDGRAGSNRELTNYPSPDERPDVFGKRLHSDSTQHDHRADDDGRAPTQPIRGQGGKRHTLTQIRCA